VRVTAIVVLAVLACGCLAAQANPVIADQIYVDFDPPQYRHWVNPDPGELVNAYVVVDLTHSYPQEFREVSFALSVTPGMAGNPVFTSFLESAIGDWRTGITLRTTGCVESFPAPVGRLSFTYQGVPGDVKILDHPTYPRWLVDCGTPGSIHIYCVRSHGGVGKLPIAGDCGVNPVDDASWGAIKALYRP